MGGTDQKSRLSRLGEVTGTCTARMAWGEVGDAIDTTDRFQVVRGTVTVLVTLGCQVGLKDFVTRTVTHPNMERSYKNHQKFLLCINFSGLEKKRKKIQDETEREKKSVKLNYLNQNSRLTRKANTPVTYITPHTHTHTHTHTHR